MSAQTDLPLPPVTAPKSLTLDQVRDLQAAALADLTTAAPALAHSLAVLTVAAPQGRRAALAALYAACPPEHRSRVRTLRALAQLLCDAEAHEARQPGSARAVTIGRPTVAEIVEAPRSLTEFQDQPQQPNP